MPIETITIAGVKKPDEGKVRGRIISQDGKVFQADPRFLRNLNLGSAYDVEYQDRVHGEAKFRVVESIVPSMGGFVNQPQMPPLGQAQVRSAQVPQSAPSYIPQVGDRRGEDIATLAIVKEWMGRIPVGDVGAAVHALKSARAAWLKFKAGGEDKIESGPSLRDELNDDIPEFGEHGER